MPVSRKRSSSPFEADNDKPAKKAHTASKVKKAAANSGICSHSKKDIGDYVKTSLKLEKYEIPRSHFEMKMGTAFFRSFFVENASLSRPMKVTPSTFDESSAVVVVELNNEEAGELLGVSEVKGGNRMTTIHLAKMCFVFFPLESRCTAWVTV